MIHEGDRRLVADGAVWPILVVVPAPVLHLFAGVGKGQEPVGVQTFIPEAPFKASMKALSVDWPGRLKSGTTPRA